MSGYSQMELNEMAAEFAMMDAEFAEMGLVELDSGLSEAFAELDKELSEAGLETLGMETGGLSELAVNDFDEAFIGKFLRNKAQKLIATVVRLVKRYASCATCVPKVTQAVAYFKAKKYGSAIRAAYDAYRCIVACTKK